MASATLHSQTVYDANRLSGSDLNGTARFVGMGGAMGALGGDISTMGTNPAGIGIYRSSDMNISFGFSNVGSKSTGNGFTSENDKFFGSFDNVGFVIALKQGNYTPVRFVNFGFNYKKLKSFDRDTYVQGNHNVSQTDYIVDLMNRNAKFYGEAISPNSLVSDGAYNFDDIPWLAPLAYQSYLINPDGKGGYEPYRLDDNTVYSDYYSYERGAIHSYDFNFSLNLYDRFYVGATLGAYSVDYRRTTSYYEDFLLNGKSEGNYELNNYYDIEGSGIDFKLGFIFRPFESSPLRIGASVATPTLYNLSAYQSTSLHYNTFNPDKDDFEKGTVFPYDNYGKGDYPSITDYKLITPWKFNVSAGYTVGNNIALGAEYEFMDYSSSKMKLDGLKMEYENQQVQQYLKGVHTIRLGAEIKVAPQFSMRAGYNLITSSMKSTSHKDLALNSVRTDTDYANGKVINNFTLGFGYRGDHFYADMAYQYRNYKEDFYAYSHRDTNIGVTEISNNKHQVLFTLGMRF